MAGSASDRDEDWAHGAQLALSDREERLPWLEPGEGEEDDGGIDSRRLALFAGLALALLVAILGAIWFVARPADAEPPADGSTIAAPETPYKVRPADAGGKVYAGTGDTSFAVGEGQTREGQLASKPAPPPTASPAPAPSAAAAAAPARPSLATTVDEPVRTATPVAPGTGVQVGAFPRRADAEAGWAALVRQTDLLNGVSHRVVEGSADIGRVYRLQAVTGSRAAAQRLCAALKDKGIACFVK